MEGDGIENARRWLAEVGVAEIREGVWTDSEQPGRELTAEEVAHECAPGAVLADGLDPVGRLRLAFGLLDLLDEYWVTAEIGFAMQDEQDPLVWEALWDCYRSRLEASRTAKNLTYSLWVDWFEDAKTVETAFTAVLGKDIDLLRDPCALDEPDRTAFHRRACRVLEVSGPVPWPIKFPIYEAASGRADLHPSLFKGLLSSYHDFHGRLEPDAALDLMRRLDLPDGTEHRAALRTVLQAGHANHYGDPNVWRAARPQGEKSRTRRWTS
ncbi:hypothetical protein GCM10009527_043090 [Actinomadura nitritigenes]|uniref:Uncharacterized protein n=1 Tax=Actinomadura nitritigenes TaxID=134602 RepID=A0ABS3R3V0_9ACTN|nr:hypothetical protein [Actinomadura nitritigenes]MBO2440937.1 hypothetical protein [Actinomadura nitritigenes]